MRERTTIKLLAWFLVWLWIGWMFMAELLSQGYMP